MSETASITIAGKTFTYVPRYAEGHTLTAIEAGVLNRTLAENMGNNFRAKVKEAVEAGAYDDAEMQKTFDAYASEYEFGIRHTSSGGVRRDPLEAEINRLATDAVKAAIKKAGLKNVSKEAITEKVAGILADEAKRAKLEKLAKSNLAALDAVSGADEPEASVAADLESGPSRKRKTKAQPEEAAAA